MGGVCQPEPGRLRGECRICRITWDKGGGDQPSGVNREKGTKNKNMLKLKGPVCEKGEAAPHLVKGSSNSKNKFQPNEERDAGGVSNAERDIRGGTKTKNKYCG